MSSMGIDGEVDTPAAFKSYSVGLLVVSFITCFRLCCNQHWSTDRRTGAKALPQGV